VVRRQFPNRLRVILQEHQAAAFWGEEGDSQLVNVQGEVFEANAGDIEDALPRLRGPAEAAPRLLEMARALRPLFEPLDLSVEEVALSGRGSWSLRLDTGAVVELGRGSQQEVLARSQRFAQTLTQVASKYGRRPDAMVSADLRHADGYALRMRGVTTTAQVDGTRR
jgi:cell division protein FtsQ